MSTNGTCAWCAACLAVVVAVGTAQTAPPAVSDQLYAAIRDGDTAKVRVLLQAGADVNVKDRRGGATPLMHAAAHGSLDTLRLVLDNGADVNARNSGGASCQKSGCSSSVARRSTSPRTAAARRSFWPRSATDRRTPSGSCSPGPQTHARSIP
jgi:hypothetical protein